MTLHGLGSAEVAGTRQTGTTFSVLSVDAGFVGSPILAGARAFKVDPVNGVPANARYGWKVAVNSQGNPRLMLTSAIIHIEDFWDEHVALMELGDGSLGGLVRRVGITNLERVIILDKDDDEVESTVNDYLATGINYRFLWLYDQRSLTDTLDVLWIRKPFASVAPAGTFFNDNDPNPDTITDAANGFGIFTAGMRIVVTGSPSNDGTYTIASVTVGVITLVPGDTLIGEFAGRATITHNEQWYKAIDVSGHGDGLDIITHLTFGSSSGKGPLPTTGGPFYFDDAVLQNLLVAPNGGSAEPKDDAKGSFSCKVKMPSANGTYGDFDAGVGAHAHPDYRHVDEIPSNAAGDYDEGNVAGDLQSYAIADVGGGEAVLAVQVVGAAWATSSVDLTPRPFIYDGTTRHNLPAFTVGATWIGLNDFDEDVTLNQINGVDLDETLFNLLEAGLEILTVQNGAVLRASQMAIEYAVPGSKALPGDFPLLAPPVTEDRRRALIQQEI